VTGKREGLENQRNSLNRSYKRKGGVLATDSDSASTKRYTGRRNSSGKEDAIILSAYSDCSNIKGVNAQKGTGPEWRHLGGVDK